MKTAGTISSVLLSVWGVLALFQLWFDFLSDGLFLKVSITFLIIGGVAVGVALIRKEYIEEQQMERDKYID